MENDDEGVAPSVFDVEVPVADQDEEQGPCVSGGGFLEQSSQRDRRNFSQYSPSSRQQFPSCTYEYPNSNYSSTSSFSDPWCPFSSSATEGVSSSTPQKLEALVSNQFGWVAETAEDEIQSELSPNRSEKKRDDIDKEKGSEDPTKDSDSSMAPPATEGASGGGGGSSGSGTKNQKGLVVCGHLHKGTSKPGVHRTLKKIESKLHCSGAAKSQCLSSPESGPDNQNQTKQWMCLQCGSVGCGNEKAQSGHAESHHKAPHSDCHSLAVLLEGGIDKIWCFECQVEVNNEASFGPLRDVLTALRRNQKIKTAIKHPGGQPAASSVPIALGPPPPPEPPKPISVKGKQNKQGNRIQPVSSSNSFGKWERDSGNVDWPLGLENLGNTCFMNSALQCLSRTRTLLDKLDLYGCGNTIEILVSPEDSCIQVLNTNVIFNDRDLECGDYNRCISDNKESGSEFQLKISSANADSSEGGSGDVSPSSTEIDSLLDAVSSRSSRKSESDTTSIGSTEMDAWKKEVQLELRRQIKLRVCISSDTMTGRLRHCFNAITRRSGHDSEERSYGRQTYTPRFIQTQVNKHFRLGHQHDSHELLRTVVDMMKKDQIKAFRLAIMQRYGVKRNEGKNCDPKLTELLKMWDRKFYHRTFVDEIFGGELVTFQECMECKNIKRSHEDFLDLSLPIRSYRANVNPVPRKTYSYSPFDDDSDYNINRSVEDCLKAYTEPEFLTGSNVVECDNCHRGKLERVERGESIDEVFPGIKDNPTSTDKGKGGMQHMGKQSKHKRPSRQSKLRAKAAQSISVSGNSINGEASASLNFNENHFENEQIKENVQGGVEEDSKSNKSGSLEEGFVVVQNSSTLNSKTTNDVEMDYDTPEEHYADVHQSEGMIPLESNLSRGLSSSLTSLSLAGNGMEIEHDVAHDDMEQEQAMVDNDPNLDEDMDDLDEPAVDGVGNASDIDDEDSNNGPGVDIVLEEKPVNMVDYLSMPVQTTADEGYSEGENSSEDKPSRSLSGSSSRNSISEADMPVTMTDKTPKKIPITKCPCSRRQLISRAPECLTLHLKRFQHTARGSSKLSDKVSFPYLLNLTQFCSEAQEDTNKPGFKTTFDEDGEVVYSLYGIVEHSGSLHFGHYVAYVKVPGKSTDPNTTTDNWFYISDSHVSGTTLKQVLIQDAYILFYERVRGDEKKRRLLEEAQRNEEIDQSPWSSNRASSSFRYEKPATVISTAAEATPYPSSSCQEESWEPDSTPVSSTNNEATEDMSITLTYEGEENPVSSSTFPLSHSSTATVVDDVSSTTGAEYGYGGGEYFETTYPMASSTAASSSHPLWDDKGLISTSDIFDSMEDEENGERENSNTNAPVSSSSDMMSNPRSSGYRKLLEEVD